MHPTTKIRNHAALLDQMANSLGADLEEAVLSGRISMDDLADSVLRCVDCGCPDACPGWVDSGATRPPDYCRNRSVLTALCLPD